MSWQTLFPDVTLDLGGGGGLGAWDADLFNDVAMLLDGHADGDDGATAAGGGGDSSTGTGELMDEDDLAILTQLLQSAQQSEAARASTPVAAEAAPLTSSVPTALVVVPPAQPPKPPPVAKKSDKTAAKTVSAELLDETIPLTGKTTRERRKEEVMFLRAKAQELEAKLGKLKQQMQLQTTGDGEQCTDLATRSQTAAPLSRYAALWMKLAKRQDEERRLALTENAKLRQLVVAQVRLARSLDRVLRKRMVRGCWEFV